MSNQITFKTKTYTMKLILLFLLTGIASWSATAQDTLQLTLKDAVDFALKNSPTKQNSATDIIAARNKVNEIKAIGLPQVNGSAGFNQYIDIPGQYIKNSFAAPGTGPEYIFLQFAQKYSATAAISANMLLYDNTYLTGLRASTAYVELTKLMDTKVEQDVTVNVVKAYFLALITKENQRLIRQNLATVKKTLSDVTAIYKEGFAELTDVQRLELSTSNLQIVSDNLDIAVETTLKVLRLHMGMDVLKPIKLTDNLESLNGILNIDVNDDITATVKNRVESKIFGQALLLSKYDEQRYKAGYFPSLSAFFNHQYSSNRSEFNFFKSNNPINNKFVTGTLWGVNLQVPIFDGFRKKNQIAQVKLSRLKTENDLRTFENATNLEYYQSKSKYMTTRQQLVQQKKNFELSKEIYDRTNARFKEGVGSASDILMAENELKTAQTNYLNSIYELLVSKIELQKSMGTNLTF